MSDALRYGNSPITFVDGAVQVALGHTARHVAERLDRYLKACAQIVEDSAINEGAPTLRGTRIRVHDLVDVLRAHGESEVRAIYPEIRQEQIEAADLFAAAHPRVGRPKRKLPANMVKTSVRRVCLTDLA